MQELKQFVKARIEEIEADNRYSYCAVDVFINAPLALIQTSMQAQITAYEIVLKQIIKMEEEHANK